MSKTTQERIAKAVRFLIYGYWLGLCLTFFFRPDLGAALSIIPVWCWFVLGVPLSILAGWRVRRHLALLLSLGAIFLLTFAEEPYALFSTEVQKTNLRVITLNWGGAGQQPFDDLAGLSPQVFLIQEAPKEETVAALAERLGLKYLWSPEAAILGDDELVELGKGVHFLHARWRSVDLVSLRLRPPLMRFDLWNPACWTAYSSRRKERREQLAEIVPGLGENSIVGGDFNVPAGDGALSPLRTDFRDCFAERSSGFGNTAPTYLPLHRIDQVWVTESFGVRRTWTMEVRGSDHRAVIVDLEQGY